MEPQWSITIHIENYMIDGSKLVEMTLDSTYFLADMAVRPDMVIDRREWVHALIHECIHLYLADMATFGAPAHPAMAAMFRTADEKSTSLIEHIMVDLFERAYLKEYKGWL